MDAQQFLAEFGHIANAPSGVARLRELILQLAISGRLVERNTPETPVSESVVAASKQRELYEMEQGLRPALQQPEIYSEPFVIPEHWIWVRLEQLALLIQRGKSPKYADAGSVRVVSQKCVKWSGFDLRQARPIADNSVAAYGEERFLCDGDVLWNSTGTGTAGRVGIYRNSHVVGVVADSHVTVIRLTDTVLPRYLWCVIASPWVQARVQPSHPDSLVSGTTQQVELATNRARALPIPCPPVEEQARIIAKVDELMSLCDKVEVQQQARRRLQNSLRGVILAAIATAANLHELQASWNRLAENFRHVVGTPEGVSELRTIVLELAIQGRLTEQLMNDGDATQLVHLVRNSGNAIQGAARSKRSRSEIADNELPFSLPANWAWARLSDVGYFLGGGTPSKSNRDYWRGDIPWVTPKDMKVIHIDSSQDNISSQAVEESAVKLIPPGALLVVVRGMILAHSFPVGVTRREVTINQDMKALCLHMPELSEFLLLILLGSRRRFLAMVERSTHGTCRLQTEKFSSCVIGIPPLAEQKRIVDRVNQLMSFCNVLQSRRTEADELSGRLAVSAVAALTGIYIEREDNHPVKPPQTELIAPLRLGQLPDVRSRAPLATILARHDGEMSARDLWQRFGGEIDAFYAQLKTEVGCRWILEPGPAEVREIPAVAEVA